MAQLASCDTFCPSPPVAIFCFFPINSATNLQVSAGISWTHAFTASVTISLSPDSRRYASTASLVGMPTLVIPTAGGVESRR